MEKDLLQKYIFCSVFPVFGRHHSYVQCRLCFKDSKKQVHSPQLWGQGVDQGENLLFSSLFSMVQSLELLWMLHFSPSALLTFCWWWRWGSHPGYCRMFSSIPGLYSLDASSQHPDVITKNVSINFPQVTPGWDCYSKPCFINREKFGTWF